MTEQLRERIGAEALEGRPRCMEESKAARPCWREAVSKLYESDDIATICAEYLEAHLLAVKQTALRAHLDQFGAWIATWDDPTVEETRLQHHAFTMRQKMVEEFWSLSIEAEAVDLIADQGPEENPLTLEQARRLAEYELRSRALFHTAQMLQDLQAVPEEAFGGEFSRWQAAGALDALDDDVNAEERRYRREIGFRRAHQREEEKSGD